MLKFLARDKSNLDKIQKLKRNFNDVKAAVSRIELARASIERVCRQCAVGWPEAFFFYRAEVRAVVNKLVQEMRKNMK